MTWIFEEKAVEDSTKLVATFKERLEDVAKNAKNGSGEPNNFSQVRKQFLLHSLEGLAKTNA